jgi:hypothetical protein
MIIFLEGAGRAESFFCPPFLLLFFSSTTVYKSILDRFILQRSAIVKRGSV